MQGKNQGKDAAVFWVTAIYLLAAGLLAQLLENALNLPLAAGLSEPARSLFFWQAGSVELGLNLVLLAGLLVWRHRWKRKAPEEPRFALDLLSACIGGCLGLGIALLALTRNSEALSLLRLLPPFLCGLVLGLLGKSKGLVTGALVLFLAPLLLLAGSWTAQGWWEEVLLEPFPAWAAMLLSWGKTAVYLLVPAAGYWMTGLHLSHRAKKK